MARRAEQVRGGGHALLPALLALTDPERTPDPVAAARLLPPGSGLVYRHFGAADRVETARRLAQVAKERDLVLLVSSDPDLADAVDAEGIHWPEKMLSEAFRRRCRGDRRLFTVATHTPRGLLAAQAAGMDAALYSAIFPSRSPSAGRAKGLWPAAAAAGRVDMPVYALGGVNTETARRLTGLGFSGVACVGATAGRKIRSAGPTRT